MNAAALRGRAQAQFLDVITLKDGQSFKGLIIEQTPEGLFRLETLSGSVLSFAAEEIEGVVKERTPGTPEGVRYQDVVFLEDGTIFRGNIMEQVLGESITLQTESGARRRRRGGSGRAGRGSRTPERGDGGRRGCPGTEAGDDRR